MAGSETMVLIPNKMKGVQMETERKEKEVIVDDSRECQEPAILEEVNIEELAVDGICGIY
jgi:mycofactocin precursor